MDKKILGPTIGNKLGKSLRIQQPAPVDNTLRILLINSFDRSVSGEVMKLDRDSMSLKKAPTAQLRS